MGKAQGRAWRSVLGMEMAYSLPSSLGSWLPKPVQRRTVISLQVDILRCVRVSASQHGNPEQDSLLSREGASEEAVLLLCGLSFLIC